MKVKLTKTFRFEASHRLDHLPDGHPCRQMHGHSYQVIVEIAGEVNPETGFLMDYGDMKEIVKPVIDELDHKHLNDIEGMEITSAEYLAKWIWDRIKPLMPLLSKITICETGSSSCEYIGE